MEKIIRLFVFVLLAYFVCSPEIVLAKGAASRDTVRILAIGNSFSQDAIEQNLYELARAEGITVIIGNAYIGGCSLERHVKNSRSGEGVYAYRKIGTDGIRKETKKVPLPDI